MSVWCPPEEHEPFNQVSLSQKPSMAFSTLIPACFLQGVKPGTQLGFHRPLEALWPSIDSRYLPVRNGLTPRGVVGREELSLLPGTV